MDTMVTADMAMAMVTEEVIMKLNKAGTHLREFLLLAD